MPGAGRIRAGNDGGALKGGAPRVVWQALDADPRTVSARSAAQRLDQLGRAGHLVWNPIHGEIVQLIPILRAGRSLGWPEDLNPLALLAPSADPAWEPAPRPAAGPAPCGAADAIAGVNAEGRLCVQICVVAFAWDPFTSGPMSGLQQILDWLDSWGIPRQWPAGRPAAFPHEQADSSRNRRLWARGGHFGASQVPGLTAVGPGAVDVELLTGWAGPVEVRPDRVPVRGTRDGENELDGYFDGAAAAAGALSRVG